MSIPASVAAALAVGFLLAAPLIASPLGDFAPPLALLLVLPPIAVGLSALGWGRWLGDHLRARVPGRERPAALFGIWSGVSALLSLDVAAVAAADVGMEVAADDPVERDLQLRAAVLGSNLGSLLFPFSNLTNLLLVAATGISFAAYVSAALAPQLVVVVVGVGVLWLAGRRHLRHLVEVVPAPGSAGEGREEVALEMGASAHAGPSVMPGSGGRAGSGGGAAGSGAAGSGAAGSGTAGTGVAAESGANGSGAAGSGAAAGSGGAAVAAAPGSGAGGTAFGRPAWVAGFAALAASVGAVVVGLAGGPVSVVFAVAAGVIVGAALLARVAQPGPVLRSIPISGVVLIVGSALLVEPVRELARGLPSAPSGTAPVDLLVVTLVGGALAALINNLPAAAFGAVWLVGAEPVTVVAYLVGTDIMCVLTAHGSLATMLVHAVAARRGHVVSRRRYAWEAWRDVGFATAAAILALILFR
jgi:Na+/H+ antiporter NhaD/arsenite permease-like protein